METDFLGRPDLVDVDHRVIADADSSEWHGSRSGLRRDAKRYNELLLDGWAVLRFSWDDVMHHPDYVRETRSRLVHQGTERLTFVNLPA